MHHIVVVPMVIYKIRYIKFNGTRLTTITYQSFCKGDFENYSIYILIVENYLYSIFNLLLVDRSTLAYLS